MDAMSTLQLSQLREHAAQLLRKYRIPLLVFLLGVALGAALVALTFRLNARYGSFGLLKEAARRSEAPKEPDKIKHNKSHEDR